ncbi:uncharacterized protein LOC143706042 [Siphateles boraxobius]|uniref:uncharacterized protein LOC143706042 n=1 Tax=Siphateles boraxobius TaxID=180520 RepID=UPI004062C75C
MEAADILCDSLFLWQKNRKECADTLLKLVQELENVPQGSNIFQVLRASISAATSTCPTSTLKKASVSSITFNKATELIKEDEKVGTNIQKQLRDLKVRCGGAPLGAHADELDCEVTSRLMWALAKKRKTPVPLDFLRGFNRATFFRHMTPGGLAPAEASDYICKALGLDRSPEITSSLKVSAKEMMKNIGRIGIKAAKAGSGVLGATGLGISLYDLIGECEKMVKGNWITEASKFLQDSSRQILEGQQKLKEQLDAMHEIIQKLVQMKSLIKALGGYSLSMNENEQRIMNYIMGTCTDNTVLSWLQTVTHQIEFVNLLRFLLENLDPIFDDLTNPSGVDIDIVIVAHGSIVAEFMYAGGLVPTPNIRDTILYSPWNCSIDSNTAFAIAQGFIRVTNREFYNNSNIAHCEPNPLPDHWNSMRGSLHNIPGILLAPVTPEERAWDFFQQFWENRGMEVEDRVIIPYVVPQNMVNAFRQIPLYMFIFVTSFILMRYNKTATVHLAACLGREGSPLRPVEWRTQYAYTSDGTVMTVNMENRNMNTVFFRALSSLFDRIRR